MSDFKGIKAVKTELLKLYSSVEVAREQGTNKVSGNPYNARFEGCAGARAVKRLCSRRGDAYVYHPASFSEPR